MGVCNCSMFCCTLLYVHSGIATILMGKRELIALLNLSSWCLVMVELLFLVVPRGCLQFVIVVFPDHTHLLFLTRCAKRNKKVLPTSGLYQLLQRLKKYRSCNKIKQKISILHTVKKAKHDKRNIKHNIKTTQLTNLTF